MTHSGGQQHPVGDRGQRFEVSFVWINRDDGGRQVFGWCDTYEGALRMAKSIDLHPSMMLPEIRDRSAGPDVV